MYRNFHVLKLAELCQKGTYLWNDPRSMNTFNKPRAVVANDCQFYWKSWGEFALVWRVITVNYVASRQENTDSYTCVMFGYNLFVHVTDSDCILETGRRRVQ